MQECPYCGSTLDTSANRRPNRTTNGTGGKTPADELVTCPDCDEVIDGFVAH